MSKKKKPIKAAPVKKAKPKKKMNPQTKEAVKTSFLTLVNNDACIKMSREYHGFGWAALAIGLALVSVIVAEVPSIVTNANTNYGENLLGTPNYSLDQGLANFSKELAAKGVILEIVDNKPHVENWENVEYTVPSTGLKSPWYSDVSTSQNKTMFEAFINSTAYLGADIEDSVFFERISKGLDIVTGSTRPGYSEAAYAVNYIAFGKDSFRIARYNASGTGGQISGRYQEIEGTKFHQIALSGDGVTPLEGEDLLTKSTDAYYDIVVRATHHSKVIAVWQNIGILSGVYVGLEFLFGLVLFLLTRGKRNPFRIYTFWETQKMSYWAGLAPALLALIMGFIMPSFGMMGFIMFFGMRLMWMSMKNMRPAA
ncbi:MAG: hypothetical protein SPG64_05115 [Candidatus Enteromonas sp.]|nr:hypothetical protein [Candidatus Enteromonas sp.]